MSTSSSSFTSSSCPHVLALLALSAIACGESNETHNEGNTSSSGGMNAVNTTGGVGGTASGGAGALGAGGTAGAPAGTGGVGAGATGGVAGTGGMSNVPVPVPDLPELTWINATCPDRPGDMMIETAELCVTLASDSQTVTGLRPKSDLGFDFTPSDRLSERSGPGYFQLGDLTLRYREAGSANWENVSTASNRTQVDAAQPTNEVLATASLTPVLQGAPLQVSRSWANEKGRLALRFDVTNNSAQTIEVGALGIPLVFNNIITGRSLDEAHQRCSFTEPYIGQDAGYALVTRLSGAGPALVVLPEAGTPFEAYNPILNPPAQDSLDPPTVFTDPTPRNNTFEGFYEWMVASRAYVENEWSSATPWNSPSSITLDPGETHTLGLRFVLASGARDIEHVLTRDQRPVAVGVPGYILPADLDAKLFLNYVQPVSDVVVEPSSALQVSAEPDTNGYRTYALKGTGWGRARVSVTYADGLEQTIHYYVTKPAAQAVSDMGAFLTTNAWFDDASDPFGRSPSVMTYDHDTNSVVTQWKQAWVAGLGDDGGATWLAEAMKLVGQPQASEVAKYERFVDGPIWGNLQYDSGSLQYGIKRTLFYYEPSQLPAGYYDSSIDWSYWGAWNQAHTLEVPRSYNYPHVTALYWAMYRLARNHQALVSNHSWDWYLNQAYSTAVAMTTIGNDYAQFGLMDGSIFVEVLRDLQREGMSAEASDLESRMRARADAWAAEAYPFGSEMPWDSTGQEEVYQWTRYFGQTSKAEVCLNAILGYTQTVPHWGYNGCARRYWDFKYGGSKIDRLERMIHHYGSSLNAIPLLIEYRDHPDDFYLLRVGYGGMMGSLSNIDQDGFPSMAMHAFPASLAWDSRTGDYGLNFFGHAYNAATYVVEHPDFGWLAFGGNLSQSGDTVSVTPLDSFRQRLYIASLGLWLTLDAGTFETLEYDTQTGKVRVALSPADAYTKAARLRIEQPATIPNVGKFAASGFSVERDAFVVPLSSSTTWVDLTQTAD